MILCMCAAFFSPGSGQGPSSFITYFLAEVNSRMRRSLWVVLTQRGRERLQFGCFYCFLLVSESPGGSEILEYTIYRGKKVMNQEPWTKARKHEHHRGAFTLAALGVAYHPSTAQHSYVCVQECNHPLTTPRLSIQKVRCFHKSVGDL